MIAMTIYNCTLICIYIAVEENVVFSDLKSILRARIDQVTLEENPQKKKKPFLINQNMDV